MEKISASEASELAFKDGLALKKQEAVLERMKKKGLPQNFDYNKVRKQIKKELKKYKSIGVIPDFPITFMPPIKPPAIAETKNWARKNLT